LADLEQLGDARVVLLVACGEGFSPAAVASARAAFASALASLPPGVAASGLRFAVLDGGSAPAVAARLGRMIRVAHTQPYAVILDGFAESERKYLMPGSAPLESAALAAFVADFAAGALQPSRLGQPRPPRDTSPHCAALTEVVTDSFEELVLDPQADVLLECYTPSCDACRAFAPRWRMLAGLLAERSAAGADGRQVRVAAMNILDNDRPLEYLPERWTPTIRLFPAAGGRSDGSARKRGVMFDYGGSGGGAGGGGAGGSGADSGEGPVELPTLPQLMAWLSQHTGGRHPLTPALRARAEALEAEAADIERAYAITLQFMEVWHQFSSLAADEEEARGGGGGGGTASAAAIADAAASRELRQRITRVYKFIGDEAAAGSAPRIVEEMQAVSDVIRRHHIMERLQAAVQAQEGEVGPGGGGQL